MMPIATSHRPSLLRNLRRDERGATAVEFGLIGLLLFLVSFGIIDFGLAYGQWVMAEKATQVGVRKAVVSNIVPRGASGLNTWPISSCGNNCSTDGTLCMNQSTGAIISDCSFSPVTCTSTAKGATPSCQCPGTPCPSGSPAASDFDAIVAEMQKMDPYIATNNVKITYSQNGLGFVSRPNGLPYTVTVTLTGMTFKFYVINILAGFRGQFKMPPFEATLIGEDLSST